MKQKLPVWLCKLHRMKTDLYAEHWLSEEKGFEQGIQLLALALSIRGPRLRLHQPVDFSEVDKRWIARWRKERARVFAGRAHSRS